MLEVLNDKTDTARAFEQATPDASVRRAQEIFALLFGLPGDRAFGVRYWDGTEELGSPSGDKYFTVVIRDATVLRNLLRRPSELAVAEAFVRNELDVEGNLEAAIVIPSLLHPAACSASGLMRLATEVMFFNPGAEQPKHRDIEKNSAFQGRLHSRARDRQAIRFHYDVGNSFYALWLDREMVYSCGYFEHEDDDLDAAQRFKMDLICRKLRLQPGERLLDIGCGWGGLIRHAARQYNVRALGITLSEEQAAYARERNRAEGLDKLVQVEVRDYRDLPQAEPFDKVVSVGMFEHVGAATMPAYFQRAYNLTAPGGLFLNHGIVLLEGLRPRRLLTRLMHETLQRDYFIRRHVFPDGDLVGVGEAISHAERAGFETRHVESLREHYTRTLRMWVDRLTRNETLAKALVGEETYRIWHLYLTAAAYAFSAARINICQMLFARS